ncbi:retrovirus-related pol polyprotein from transposon TNT 1-94 [Tanacetum coccineum]
MGTVRFGNDHVATIRGYGDYQIGNVMISRVKFLRSKDETPEIVIKLLKKIQVCLNATVRNIRTDNGTEFVNQTVQAYYDDVGISHQTSVARTPRHNKTPYELIHDRKPNLTYFYVFGALCYPTNDGEDSGKLKPKAYIGIFVGYAPAKKAYRIYNSLGFVQIPPSTTPYVPPTKNDWDLLFQPMFDEYFNPLPSVVSPVPTATAPRPVDLTDSPLSTSIDQATRSASTSSTIQETQSLVISKGVEEQLQPAQLVDDPFLNILTSEASSQESSSTIQPNNLPFEHISKWTKIHPLENVIGNPSRPIST